MGNSKVMQAYSVMYANKEAPMRFYIGQVEAYSFSGAAMLAENKYGTENIHHLYKKLPI